MSGSYKFNPDNMENILFHSVDHISRMYDSIKLLREYTKNTGRKEFSYREMKNILAKGLNDNEPDEIIDQLIWENVIVEDTASRMSS